MEARIPYTGPMPPEQLAGIDVRKGCSMDQLIHNLANASYVGEPVPDNTFPLFSKMPTELRIRVWKNAIAVPQIIDLTRRPFSPRKVPGSKNTYLDGHWRYKNSSPPAVLWTCSESRKEALKVYKNYSTSSIVTSMASPEWTRYDWDILKLKDLELAEEGEGATQTRFRNKISRWEDHIDAFHHSPTRINGSNRWIGRPDGFAMVQALAVDSHRIFSTLKGDFDDVECIIRHFFPNLSLLVVLIVEPPDGTWSQKGDQEQYLIHETFTNYDSRFVSSCYPFQSRTGGPFRVPSAENTSYVEYVLKGVQKRFQREKDDYHWYTPPQIIVRVSSLPKDA